MMIDKTLARIRAYRIAQGMTITALERAAQLAGSTLRDIDDPGWSPSVATVRKIEAVIPAGWKPRKKESKNG